jgi:hypothetical protein
MIQNACRPFVFAMSLLAAQTAEAGQCFTTGPRYHLEADTVEWRMEIHSNENCVRGVRFSYVYNATVSVVTAPRFGKVAVVGSGFSYSAMPNFRGEDSFVIAVLGDKKKVRGVSNIHVAVSVSDTKRTKVPTFARFEASY